MSSLKEKYQKEVVPQLIKAWSYRNVMAVPRLEKVVLNIGFGSQISGKQSGEQKEIQKNILGDLAQISGQRPAFTVSRKSIAGFKIRKGMLLGAKVTLRRERMYDFLIRLIHISLPRSRDFRGIREKSVDKKGNLNIGVKEHIVFPEVFPEKTKKIFSFQITIVTTSRTREEAQKLFRLLGFPLEKGTA